MSEYTKGPWTYRVDARTATARVDTFGGLAIGSAVGFTAEEAEANARLIAAAPELLEALQTLVDDCIHASGSMDYNYGEFDLKAAEAAILKATGNQQ